MSEGVPFRLNQYMTRKRFEEIFSSLRYTNRDDVEYNDGFSGPSPPRLSQAPPNSPPPRQRTRPSPIPSPLEAPNPPKIPNTNI